MRNMLMLIAMLLVSSVVDAQTYLYKRVMIVQNGQRIVKNDDAHYITFTNNGCYESDSKGYGYQGEFVKFIKNENNLHCYYGRSSFGQAHFYFANDYSRLNVHVDDQTIYVYQRELSGRTTASLRPDRQTPKRSSGVIMPISPIGGSGGTSSGESTTQSKSSYTKCSDCNGTGICKGCRGYGDIWANTGYYVGKYIETRMRCGSCGGDGKCKICHGKGKL